MENFRVQLLRTLYQDKQTLGKLFIHDGVFEQFRCATLELPWKNNQRRISCIPVGAYKCVKHRSPKFGDCLHVLNVPGRSEILIHYGNYYQDTLGCILPGVGFADIDKDGWLDVTHSKDTIDRILAIVPDSFIIEVTGSHDWELVA